VPVIFYAKAPHAAQRGSLTESACRRGQPSVSANRFCDEAMTAGQFESNWPAKCIVDFGTGRRVLEQETGDPLE
jgi:hypothetical protein